MKRPRRPKKKLPSAPSSPDMSYQWASTHPNDDPLLAHYLESGWKISKHPAGKPRTLPPGVVLLEITTEKYREFIVQGIRRAKKQFDDANELFQVVPARYGMKSGGRSFPLVSPDFMVSSDYPKVAPDAQPVDVDVTIKLKVSVRWQDAAAALGLSLAEYARRRLLMEQQVLGPSATFIEDNAYEPVELSFTRKD